jgi:hypothetical protein
MEKAKIEVYNYPALFVKHAKDVFTNERGEDIPYNNLILSDGLQAFKVPAEIDKVELREGDEVIVSLRPIIKTSRGANILSMKAIAIRKIEK